MYGLSSAMRPETRVLTYVSLTIIKVPLEPDVVKNLSFPSFNSANFTQPYSSNNLSSITNNHTRYQQYANVPKHAIFNLNKRKRKDITD